MTGQFVDLFNREKHGLNFWAGVAVFLGLLVGFGFHAVEMSYWALVHEITPDSPDGNPQTLIEYLFRSFRFGVWDHAGFAVVLVVSGGALKKDVLLPFLAGFLAVLWGVVMRAVGFLEGPALSPGIVTTNFLWTFIVVGSVVLCYRLLGNKLMGIAMGMALGTLIFGTVSFFRYDFPLYYFATSTAKQLCTSFIAGVFLFAGISRHFSSQGMRFGEYGLDPTSEGRMPYSLPDPAMGKVRGPLGTILLMLLTLNLYAFRWIYSIYSELHRRPVSATRITPGRALGFLFIPVFNLFWALRLSVDLPRAVEKMELGDPPSGVSPQPWIISGSFMASGVMGIVGGFWWFPALYLNAVLLWTGVLLLQSSLNSHWEAHRKD